MGAPDPHGVHLEEREGGGFSLTAEIWAEGNRRHRLARMRAVMRRLRLDGWKCERCRGPVPIHKRADAEYCSESCRRADARARRKARATVGAALRTVVP